MVAYLADDLAAYLTGGGLAALAGAIVAAATVIFACIFAIYGMARSIR